MGPIREVLAAYRGAVEGEAKAAGRSWGLVTCPRSRQYLQTTAWLDRSPTESSS